MNRMLKKRWCCGLTVCGFVFGMSGSAVATYQDGAPLTREAHKDSYISLDFTDAPTRQVLQIIAQANGFNLVVSDDVEGNISIVLKDVPWQQALDTILKIKGLDQRIDGNILLIGPAETLFMQDKLRQEAQVSEQALAPILTQTLQINYARATDLVGLLHSEGHSTLTERGSVSVDQRTNQLIVADTDASFQKVKTLIKKIDVPVKQVLIESRMITVRDNLDQQLGLRWGLSDNTGSSLIGGSIEGIVLGSEATLPDRFNINLPIAQPAGRVGVQIARILDGRILDLELSALEAENKGEIIATPKILVANQSEAYIEQGTEIPFVQANENGALSVEFKKAVLSLRVTPHITPEEKIILNLVITQDTRGDIVQTSTGPAVAIDTQEVSTQVLVNNSETIVLGGIFQQNTAEVVTQVPFFGKLPLVGKLFRSKQRLREKRELLIFVTPQILEEN